jgi:hypothetical protein
MKIVALISNGDASIALTVEDGLEPAHCFDKKRSLGGPIDETCDEASERG